MFSIAQSTSFVHVFKAYLSSDHVTEATGKTIAITISKAGGAFGNPNAGATNATEISSGWYKVTLDTTDTGTLGILAIRGAVATIDDFGDRLLVVSATTGGLANLDAAITTRMATYTQPTGFLSATFPSGTVANTTNITAGTIATVTTLTNLPSIPANWLTAAGINAGALNGKGDWLLSSSYTAPSNLTAAQIATGVWQDTTAGDFTTALSVGKSVMNGVSLGTGLTIAAVSGAVGSVTGAVGSVTGAVGSVTGNIGGNVVGSVASVTAGVTVTTNNDKTGYSLTQTFPSNFSATVISAAGIVSADIKKVNAITVTGSGTAGTPWGP